MTHYNVEGDEGVSERWHLKTPYYTDPKDTIYWTLTSGTPVKVPGVVTVPIQYEGPEIDFTLAGFDVPVVRSELLDAMVGLDPKGIQRVRCAIPAHPGFEILVATRAIACVDERGSKFVKWTEDDGRPDKTGSYRMFTRLVIDDLKIPKGVHIFRVEGWTIALVVSEDMKQVMESTGCSGIVFEEV